MRISYTEGNYLDGVFSYLRQHNFEIIGVGDSYQLDSCTPSLKCGKVSFVFDKLDTTNWHGAIRDSENNHFIITLNSFKLHLTSFSLQSATHCNNPTYLMIQGLNETNNWETIADVKVAQDNVEQIPLTYFPITNILSSKFFSTFKFIPRISYSSVQHLELFGTLIKTHSTTILCQHNFIIFFQISFILFVQTK